MLQEGFEGIEVEVVQVFHVDVRSDLKFVPVDQPHQPCQVMPNMFERRGKMNDICRFKRLTRRCETSGWCLVR